ncbi:MAG: hypothetical protein AAGD28_04995 [Bacteroidota bacterium]
MKIPCLLLFSSLILFSCSPKEKENRTLGHHLEDFQVCMEDPDESFDNIRDLSLGYSLSYPEYWEPKENSDEIQNTISASRTIIDSSDYSLKDAMFMAVHFIHEELSVDSALHEVLNRKKEDSFMNQSLNKGKGIVFGKDCVWSISRFSQEGISFKILVLHFASRDNKHMIAYEYRVLDTDQWYQNLCDMLRFKQDV